MADVKGVFKYVENASNYSAQICSNNIDLQTYAGGQYNGAYQMPIFSLNNIGANSMPATNYNDSLMSIPIFNLQKPSLSSYSGLSNSFGLGTDFSVNTNHNLGTSLAGYNAQKGSRLASYALSHQAGRWNSQCAKYVKSAIQGAGLGNYIPGHGYQMASVLSGNSNFKQISNKFYLGYILITIGCYDNDIGVEKEEIYVIS